MRGESDGSGAALVALFIIGAVLWALRWFILAALAVAALVLAIVGVVMAAQALLHRQEQRRQAELDRLTAIRRRAEIQNAQVLRGDPAGFFGDHPLPDPELIPAWYTFDRHRPNPEVTTNRYYNDGHVRSTGT